MGRRIRRGTLPALLLNRNSTVQFVFQSNKILADKHFFIVYRKHYPVFQIAVHLIFIYILDSPLTAMLGLTGIPMAIGALAVFGSSFMNYVFFGKMKFGSKKDTIAVAIEPLTQADIISANPIPVYVTNFIGGALSGIIVSLMGLVNMTPGTATPIAGFAVMFAYNPAIKVLIAAAGCIIVSVISGYIGYLIFRNKKILTADEIRNTQAA